LKRHVALIATILTLSLTLACNLGQAATPTTAPTSTPEVATRPPSLTAEPPTPTRPAGGGPGRCGDGVCDGPENVDNCPEDCAAPTAEAQPTSITETMESTARPGLEPGTYWVTNPTSGVELFVAVMRPQDWDGESLPTLVIIPGGTDDSSAITDRAMGRVVTEEGFVVVAFDSDGRGRSAGEEDYNGFTHQDGLAAVIEFAASLPEVDADQMGMVSLSYGVTLASGTLARYPDLPICFLVDWEGPADRYDTTVGCKLWQARG